MIRRWYYRSLAASVVLLLCCAVSCPAFLCLPPASSSSLLAEQRQHHLHSLSGPATSKGRDSRKPLLAGCAPSSPCTAAKQSWSGRGPWGNPAGEGSSVPLGAVGCGVGPSTSVAPTVVSSPPRDGSWHHKIWSNWEQGDRRCVSREWVTPVTQSCPKVLLLSLYLVNLAAFLFVFLFSLRYLLGGCVHGDDETVVWDALSSSASNRSGGSVPLLQPRWGDILYDWLKANWCCRSFMTVGVVGYSCFASV